MRTLLTSSLMAIACMVSSQTSGGQARAVPDAVECARCRVVLDTIAVLGRSGSRYSFPEIPAGVRIGPDGRYWVYGPTLGLLVIAPDGRTATTVGRRGQGPGEFGFIGDVLFISGDTAIIFDSNFRVSWIDRSLRHVRSVQLPPHPLSPSVILHWPDSVASNGMVFRSMSAGWPLHLVSFANDSVAVLKSFGPDRRDPAARFPSPQNLATSRSGGFWSADRVRYRLHRWTGVEQPAFTVERTPSWFAKPSEDWLGNKTTEPPPLMAGISEGDDGVVWGFVHRSASTWKEAWKYPDGATEVGPQSIDFEKLYQVHVEALNLATGRVRARIQFPGLVINALPRGQAVLVASSNDGSVFQLSVVRFRVVER